MQENAFPPNRARSVSDSRYSQVARTSEEAARVYWGLHADHNMAEAALHILEEELGTQGREITAQLIEAGLNEADVKKFLDMIAAGPDEAARVDAVLDTLGANLRDPGFTRKTIKRIRGFLQEYEQTVKRSEHSGRNLSVLNKVFDRTIPPRPPRAGAA